MKFYHYQQSTVMFNKDDLMTIREHLLQTEETIAVAESVTAGFLQAAFSSIPDAARFFQGGITAYNLGQKYRHLHVNPIHAERCDCVSEKVAGTMAAEVGHLFGSQWGIGITGYASKVPEGKNGLFAHFAIAHQSQVVKEGIVTATTQEGEATQLFYVNTVLAQLQEYMQSTTNQPAKKSYVTVK